MREIFSVRFFAAVGVVVGLFFLLTAIFATGEAIDGDDIVASPTRIHRIDLVDQVFTVNGPELGFTDDGLVVADVVFVFDRTRSLRVVADTPGVDHCRRSEVGACAVVADLLGEAVVWFALVPMGDGRTVPLPAIDVLDDGYARLVNGWELRYAPVLDRRCQDDSGAEVEFASYREFRDVLGDDFTSLYSIVDARIEAVVCRERVAYAPDLDQPTASTTEP
jgi:hypothetical protein